MKVSDLSASEIGSRLRNPASGLCLRTGPYSCRVFADSPFVDDGLQLLYGAHRVLEADAFMDFNVHIENSGGLRRWWRKQVTFSTDGVRPFAPLPAAQAYPLLEWALNWCLSSRAHDHLNLHAAALERGGRVLVLPAPPGSGKSTLCAGLVLRGWRLLSDELAMLSPQDGLVTPLVRPISLKNASIDVVRAFDSAAVLNKSTPHTVKGTVSHMQPPSRDVMRAAERAEPRWVVFPKYVAGAMPKMTPRSRADSLLELGRNAFNYSVLGLAGFETLSRLVDRCDCYDFSYSRLDDAARVFEELSRTSPAPARENEAVAA